MANLMAQSLGWMRALLTDWMRDYQSVLTKVHQMLEE